MNERGIIGAILLVAGIVLFVIGVSSSDSLADQVSETFTGRFTDATMWYIIGGLVSGFGGLLLLLVGGARGKNA